MSEFTHLNMFHSHVSFISYPSIPGCSCRLSRAIHQHTFSHLAGTQFTDCMTCLTSQTFLFCFSHTIALSPVFLCLSLLMFELVFVFTCLFSCFHLFTVFPSKCAPTWLSRAIHQHTFSRLAGAQFTDCMTCLTSQMFLFYFPHTIAFLPVFQYFSLHMFELVFLFTCLFLCFH